MHTLLGYLISKENTTTTKPKTKPKSSKPCIASIKTAATTATTTTTTTICRTLKTDIRTGTGTGYVCVCVPCLSSHASFFLPVFHTRCLPSKSTTLIKRPQETEPQRVEEIKKNEQRKSKKARDTNQAQRFADTLADNSQVT